jgi:hypothetical protein
MLKSRHVRFIPSDARRRAPLLVLACAASLFVAAGTPPSAARAGVTPRAARQTQRLDIRMRSFAPPASGHVTVEASGGGGSGRVTVLSLPDPQTIVEDARVYVVWAVSEGRIARLGELRRDERGNGGLAFERPAAFERYSVVVTAEIAADAERPGAPVLSTRANEATTLYPPAAPDRAATTPAPEPSAPQPSTTPAPTTQPTAMPTPTPTPAQPPLPPTPSVPASRPRTTRAASFFVEVEDAITLSGGGRVIELGGERPAPDARGTARAATHEGSAYVLATFRGVPLPSTVGASVYVLWAIVPDGRIVYMGSLPSTEDLNAAGIYVRTAGFGQDTFELFVTAERARPAPAPSDNKVLTPKQSAISVK